MIIQLIPNICLSVTALEWAFSELYKTYGEKDPVRLDTVLVVPSELFHLAEELVDTGGADPRGPLGLCVVAKHRRMRGPDKWYLLDVATGNVVMSDP